MKMVHLLLLFFILIALLAGNKSYALHSSIIYGEAEKKSTEPTQDNRGSGRRNYGLIMQTVA